MAAGQLKGVPVLVYHGLTKTGTSDLPFRERKYWAPVSAFQEQMQEIRHRKYKVLSLQSWFEVPDPASPSVAVTFDDGRDSDYELAFPLLLECGVTATFFLNTATVGCLGHLSWSQARSMQAYGMSFQSHGHDHVYLTPLSGTALSHQLTHSRKTLEDRLGREVDLLAPPYGRFNSRVIDAARKAGYRALCSGRSWPARPGSMVIDRVAVYRGTTIRDFERILAGEPLFYLSRAARFMALEIPKSILLRFYPASLMDHGAEAYS